MDSNFVYDICRLIRLDNFSKNGKKKVEKIVSKNGKSYVQSFWVKPEENTSVRTKQISNRTDLTQVSTTEGTYRKTGQYLQGFLKPKSKILSVGAGLDQTRKGLYSGLGRDYEIHDFEPNPGKRKEPPEFTSANEIPQNMYDAVVSHNVLNVVEPSVREEVMRTIFTPLREGGHAIVGVRKWAGDVNGAKNFTPSEHEEKAIWVHKKAGTSYQRGFDGNELVDYIKDYAERNGHDITIKKLPGISANGVHVQLIKKADPRF